MPIEIVVPRLGWSMEEGTFGQWLKEPGAWIKAGEMLFELEGEKATQEIESFDSGILYVPADAPESGDTVVVGQLIAYLLEKGEKAPSCAIREYDGTREDFTDATNTTTAIAPKSVNSNRPLSTDSENLLSNQMGAQREEQRKRSIAISPRARRVAKELDIDWSKVAGSGRNGRVRERDIRAAANAGSMNIGRGKLHKISKIRRTIATRMLAAVQETAPVTLTTKVDATNLVQVRKKLATESARSLVLSYNDILAKIVAEALPKCETLNARWQNSGILVFEDVNIAIAVDTPNGLVAPVIHDVRSLSLQQVAEKSQHMIQQARQGKLTGEQLSGGTFTITNLGMFDIDHFTPIINLPQTAILGIGRIVREPAVIDDRIVARDQMSLSLTFDHRVLDGAPAAKWLQQLSRLIENPSSLLSK